MKRSGCLYIIIIIFAISVGMLFIVDKDGKLESDKENIVSNEKLLSKVIVQCKDMKSEDKKSVTAVTVKNTSDKLFKGTISVTLKDEEKTKDIADLDIELAPNTSVIKNIKCKELNNPNYSYKINGEFQTVKYYSSKYYHEIIFEKDSGTLKQLYVLVDKIDKSQLDDIIKEYKGKYKEKLSSVKFFDKSQKVTIGQNPYLKNIDEKASYTIGDNKLSIY